MALTGTLSCRFKQQGLDVLQCGEGLFDIVLFHISSGLLDQNENLPEPDTLHGLVEFRLSVRWNLESYIRPKFSDHRLNQERSHFPVFSAFCNALPSAWKRLRG
jgi:hypothetical protein